MMKPVFYLSTPYSKYDQGTEQAYRDAALAAATLIKQGMFVFSPVVHAHPIATIGGIDPLSHDKWLPLDIAMLDACDGLIVIMMPGWEESFGIKIEIEHAKATHKHISYLSWPMLNVREDVEGSKAAG